MSYLLPVFTYALTCQSLAGMKCLVQSNVGLSDYTVNIDTEGTVFTSIPGISPVSPLFNCAEKTNGNSENIVLVPHKNPPTLVTHLLVPQATLPPVAYLFGQFFKGATYVWRDGYIKWIGYADDPMSSVLSPGWYLELSIIIEGAPFPLWFYKFLIMATANNDDNFELWADESTDDRMILLHYYALRDNTCGCDDTYTGEFSLTEPSVRTVYENEVASVPFASAKRWYISLMSSVNNLVSYAIILTG